MKAASCLFLFLCIITQATQSSTPRSFEVKVIPEGEVAQEYGRLPLSFESNQGQSDSQVLFLARGGGYSIFLTSRDAVLVFRTAAGRTRELASSKGGVKRDEQPPVLRIRLRGAKVAAKVSGVNELPGRSNYFIGNDPKKWRVDVPTYAKVKYEGVYPGIDMVYYGNQGRLEYDFVVGPWADSRCIEFDVRGAGHISRDRNGDLVLHSGKGEIRWNKPVVYQVKEGKREEIAGHYVVEQNRVSFAVSNYDRKRALVIDPALVYSTYLGGAHGDTGLSIAVDSKGSAYVTGSTSSTDFPTINPLQALNGGSGDAFVTKLNPTGSALVYSTYLGGIGSDTGTGIALDRSGNAYVVGITASTDFPVRNALQPVYGGSTDAFVTKLNPTGSALVYSTYLGGSNYDSGSGIAVDGSGKAYIVGLTASTDFPTMNALQPGFKGIDDGFVSGLNSAGSAFVYSTYLGGSDYDQATKIAVDRSGHAYIGGNTKSTDFPTVNPFQPFYGGGSFDAFIAEVNSTGSAMVYSTYFGGSDVDLINGIALDGLGNAYVVGQTCSSDLPLKNPLQPLYGGGCDAFVSRVNASGSALGYSTYLGGSGSEAGLGIAIAASGTVFVTGQTASGNFPLVKPLQRINAGSDDAFVSVLNPEASALVYSTYLGGQKIDSGEGIAVDRSGDVYLTGFTWSTGFPTKNPLQPHQAGLTDAFVTKISPASMVASPNDLNFGKQNVNTTSPPEDVTLANVGTQAVNITKISITGTNAGDFAQTNTCSTSVAAGASCLISITFTPTATGTRATNLSVSESGGGNSQIVSLTGTGT